MGQLKAPKVNWIDQAWFIRETICGMPSAPPGDTNLSPRQLAELSEIAAGKNLLAARPVQLAPTKWPEDAEKAKRLNLTLELLRLHLAYRTFKHYRVSFPRSTGSADMFDIVSRNPAETVGRRKFLRSIGVQLTAPDEWAVSAAMMIGHVLIDRYVCEDWKQRLPLAVASVSGPSQSEVAGLRATQPRLVDRRSTLSIAVDGARKLDPSAQYSEILNRLVGGDVVKEYKDDRVWYWTAKGRLESVSIESFRTVFAKQAPAGKSKKKPASG